MARQRCHDRRARRAAPGGALPGGGALPPAASAARRDQRAQRRHVPAESGGHGAHSRMAVGITGLLTTRFEYAEDVRHQECGEIDPNVSLPFRGVSMVSSLL